MDSARTKLLDLLSKYQAMRKCRIIAVFDAYRVQRRKEDIFDYDSVHVVFTKEAQTADEFIESLPTTTAGDTTSQLPHRTACSR